MSRCRIVDDPCGCGICNVCHIWLASHRPENRIREHVDGSFRTDEHHEHHEQPEAGDPPTTESTQTLWRVVSLRGRWPKHIQAGEFVYVGRPFAGLEGHPLGNPFSGPTALERYANWLARHPDRNELLRQLHADTEGGRIPIACWCGDWQPGQPPIQCHAHTLANLLLSEDQS